MSKVKESSNIASILTQLATAGASELAELEAAIAAKEAERDALVGKLEGELSGLRKVARIVHEFVHGKQPRKTRQPRGKRTEPATAQPVVDDDAEPVAVPKRRGRPPNPKPAVGPPASGPSEDSADASLRGRVRNYLEYAAGPAMPQTIANDLREKLVPVKNVLVNNRTVFRETSHGWVLKRDEE
jgi:hypothetical protein